MKVTSKSGGLCIKQININNTHSCERGYNCYSIRLYIFLNMNFTSIINKLNPTSYKLMRIVLIQNKMISSKYLAKTARQYHSFQSNAVVLSTMLAFLWPIKKKKEVLENISAGTTLLVLDTADNLFESGHYEQCYELLKEYEKNCDVEIQWRLCRVLYNMSKEIKYDKKYKQNLMLQAYEIISQQLDKNQDHYAVHKWYALLLDAKSTQDGIKERIRQLENIKKHMDVAVTLNPNDATVLYMLGEWCFQVTELSWHQRKIAEVLFASPPYSTYEDALEYFLRAESVQPRFYSLNLLRIGMCYYRLQKEDQAKYYLKLAASYPAKSNDDHKANTEAAELLKHIK